VLGIAYPHARQELVVGKIKLKLGDKKDEKDEG
jgi:hypothetical protein